MGPKPQSIAGDFFCQCAAAAALRHPACPVDHFPPAGELVVAWDMPTGEIISIMRRLACRMHSHGRLEQGGERGAFWETAPARMGAIANARCAARRSTARKPSSRGRGMRCAWISIPWRPGHRAEKRLPLHLLRPEVLQGLPGEARPRQRLRRQVLSALRRAVRDHAWIDQHQGEWP